MRNAKEAKIAVGWVGLRKEARLRLREAYYVAPRGLSRGDVVRKVSELTTVNETNVRMWIDGTRGMTVKHAEQIVNHLPIGPLSTLSLPRKVVALEPSKKRKEELLETLFSALKDLQKRVGDLETRADRVPGWILGLTDQVGGILTLAHKAQFQDAVTKGTLTLIQRRIDNLEKLTGARV
jgi:hypothetical protein